jgi:Na+/phosphate symporter
MAFTFAAVFAYVIFHLQAVGAIAIMALGSFIILRNHRLHKKREKEAKAAEIFNLKKVKDGKYAISTTFEHAGYFLKEVARVLSDGYEGLATQNRPLLKQVKKDSKKIQGWANIIVANIFKTLCLLQKEDPGYTGKYAQAVSVLQEIAECQRDAVRRAHSHVDNHHKPMLPVQLEELKQILDVVVKVLQETASAMMDKEVANCRAIEKHKETLKLLEKKFDEKQVKRIQDETSKTRLSILFYGTIRDSNLVVEQTLNLLNIFRDSFGDEKCID